MNNDIPNWWLIVSALFFVANLVFFIVLAYLGVTLVRVLKETKPKVDEISTKVSALVTKVEQVAVRVEEVANSVKETVDNVGGRAKGVVGSAELVAQSASRQFERFSPFVVGAMTAMRLVKALNEMRHGRSAASATKKGTLKKKPASKKSSGILGLFGKH